jgi:choline monooxygenase
VSDAATRPTEPILGPLGALEDGWTLPASWYSDPEVYTLERSIFERAWQYAGPAELAQEPGSFFATQAGHIPVVVTRDRAGVLHGFVNVCRHRGHLVASGAGCRETLQCPYHAWTYGLDGSLKRAPRSDREPGFDASTLGLLPVSVDTWGPWAFVNPDPAAEPLADTLADLPELLAQSGLDLSVLRYHSHHEFEQRVNWKVSLENYLECYHCPVAHPGFSKVIDVDPDSYELLVEPTYSSQVGPVRPSALLGNGKAPYDPRGEIAQSHYHFIWPNTTINIDPGPQNVSIERWLPAGPHKTAEVTDYWFGADVSEERAQELIAFGTQVAIEDVALCERVQAGLDSNAMPQGRLMLSSEGLIHDFQRRVRDAVAG